MSISTWILGIDPWIRAGIGCIAATCGFRIIWKYR